jgi:hypothetical protein
LSGIDCLDTPLEDFSSTLERREDGTYAAREWPYGDGEAQRFMAGLSAGAENTYARLLSEEDLDRFAPVGRVPLIRDGRRGYEPLETLMLKDLPVILDTFVVLEEEYKRREREESERKSAERKERERIRAKERRRLKKLGEW